MKLVGAMIFLLKGFPLIFLDGFLVRADLFLTHGTLFLDDKDFFFFQNVPGKPQSQRNETGRPVTTHCVATGMQNCSGFLLPPDPKMDAILALRSFPPGSKPVALLYFSIFTSGKEGRFREFQQIARFWVPPPPAPAPVALSPVLASEAFEIFTARKLRILKE